MPLLALEYPNGQIYEVESPDDLEVDQVFEMYGRRWRVIGPSMQDGSDRYGKRAGSRLVCQQQP